ncbi:MAG TPA: TolC family protein [Opitutales bacterium]|nr:TolC family protein [Opitutales bacterium]
MQSLRRYAPLGMRARFIAVAGLTSFLVAATIFAQTTPAADDPMLQPLPDYTLPAPGQPLPGSEEQIEQLLAYAANHAPAMTTQAELIDQSDASRFRSWIRHMPILTASYSVGLYYAATGANSGGSATPGGSLTLQASQPIWHWGGFDAQTDLGILNEQIAQNEGVLNYAKLCLDVRKRYLALVVLKAQAATYAREAESAQRALDKQNLLLTLGRATQKDAHNAELDLNKVKLNADKAATDLKNQLNEFHRVTGSANFGESDLPDHIYLPVAENTTRQAELDAAEKNGPATSPLSRDAALQDEALQKQLIMNQASRKPQFDLTASVSQSPYVNASNSGLKFATIFFVGVSGSWVLADRGESVAEDEKLNSQRRMVESQYADTRAQTMNDATNCLNQIDLGLRACVTLKALYAQEQENYRQAQTMMGLGRGDPTDLDSARDALLDTRLELLTREADIAGNYYSFLSDIYLDPALAHPPAATQPK